LLRALLPPHLGRRDLEGDAPVHPLLHRERGGAPDPVQGRHDLDRDRHRGDRAAPGDLRGARVLGDRPPQRPLLGRGHGDRRHPAGGGERARVGARGPRPRPRAAVRVGHRDGALGHRGRGKHRQRGAPGGVPPLGPDPSLRDGDRRLRRDPVLRAAGPADRAPGHLLLLRADPDVPAGASDGSKGGRVGARPAIRWGVLAGFLTVYLVWGSTYLAIRIALETLPPFLMAGARFLAAGGLLYAWARSRGAPRPEPAHWRAALVLGALFLLLGNGGVVWAEQRVPSGLAALMVGLTPVWTALFEWRAGGERPSAAVAVGLAAGVAGVALLVAPGRLAAGAPVDPLGAAACLISSVSWSFGSVRSRGLRLPA